MPPAVETGKRAFAVSGRGDRLWWLAAAGLAVALAVPFFLVDVPPVEDYPNHLARIFLLAFGADDPILSRIYAPDWHLVPNLAIDIIGPPLMQIVPVHVAGRILLALSLILPVAGVLAYSAAVFRRSTWWSLVVGLVAYNAIFILGFMNFLIGIGLALLGAAFWIATRERHPAIAAEGGAIAAAVIFFAHIFGVAYFALLIGAHELVRLRRLRRNGEFNAAALLSTIAMVAIALAPAVVLYVLSPLAGADTGVAWDAPARKVFELFVPFLNYSKLLALVIGIAVVALIVLLWRNATVDAAMAVAFVVLLVLYAVAPRAMMGGTFVDTRLVLMAALLLFAGFAPVLPPVRLPIVAVGLATLVVLSAGTVAYDWLEHRNDLADFRRVIGHVEPGAKVLLVAARPEENQAYSDGEPASRRIPDIARTDGHLAALLLIERRAFWPLLFADPAQHPIKVLPPYDRIATTAVSEAPDYRDLAALPANAPTYLVDWQANFDYVLVMDAGAVDLSNYLPDRLTLVDRADIATLFSVRH